ncbi:MAG: FtsX-like permease family protein [Rikenellaceae bacterium]
MTKFKTEYFLAKRLSNEGDSKGVMSRIATLTVAVGLCVMILAVAVINGFKDNIYSKLEILGSDVKIVAIDTRGSIDTKPIEREEKIETTISSLKQVKSISPYALKTGVIKGKENIQGIVLKGIENSFNTSMLEEYLVEGAMPRLSDSTRYKDLLIPQRLAKKLQISLDERIELIFLDDSGKIKKDKYAVKGIYNSDMEQVDETLLVTDMRNVQKLNNWTPNQVSGYEILSTPSQDLELFTNTIFFALLDVGSSQSLACVNIKESFPMIFDWLSAHNVNGAVIIIIMLVVAIFNMISALLIILLERTSMIGTLKALGMNNSSLGRIFLLRSAKIVLTGMFWGNILAISMCLIQKYTNIITLDSGGYFLSAVPISLSWGEIVGLNALTFVIICVVMMLPTRIILYIKPDITLRYK